MQANEQRQFRLIDLFSGAGGLTLGFSKKFGNPFVSVWANDFNDYAARTYNANFGQHCVVGDIVNILEDPNTEIPKADIVIGGPPCQGFSLLNKNRESDSRKQLWRPFLEVVSRSGSSVFVMENVPQLLGSPEHDEIIEEAERLGFRLTSAKLCAADYGVPQVRWRAFIVGSRYVDPKEFFPPLRTHYNSNIKMQLNENGKNGHRKIQSFDHDDPTEQLMLLAPGTTEGYIEKPEPWVNVRAAIGDLSAPQGTEIRAIDPPYDLHFGRNPTPLSIERYRAIPKEGMNRFNLQEAAPHLTPPCWIRKTTGGTDLFGRLWWSRPAFTIRTEFFKPEKGRYLHPEQHRPITHREAARFQSFPDDFRFTGSKIEIARQIGNAVPPLLGAHVAAAVARMMIASEAANSAG